MVNGNPGVHYGVAKIPRQAMDNGERAKKFGALGRALTSWLTATKRIEPLKASAESDRELEGRSPRAPCLERNSLLFPARVGRDLHPAPRIYLRFPMFISLAGFGGRRVLGDFPAKLPEARDFPLSGDQFGRTGSAPRIKSLTLHTIVTVDESNYRLSPEACAGSAWARLHRDNLPAFLYRCRSLNTVQLPRLSA